MTGLSPTVLRSLTHSQDLVANPAASIAYQPFDFVPIATQLFSAALPNPVTSLAIVIPHFFRIHHDRAARVFVWCERALQSSISFLDFSAPAHLPSDVQISDSASGCGRIYTGPVIAVHRNSKQLTPSRSSTCASPTLRGTSACFPLVYSTLPELCINSWRSSQKARRVLLLRSERRLARNRKCRESRLRSRDRVRSPNSIPTLPARSHEMSQLNSFSPRRKANSA
jgi:hypothetical protein